LAVPEKQEVLQRHLISNSEELCLHS
jgi:hypothetical protein